MWSLVTFRPSHFNIRKVNELLELLCDGAKNRLTLDFVLKSFSEKVVAGLTNAQNCHYYFIPDDIICQ